jgi:hypothetical protein
VLGQLIALGVEEEAAGLFIAEELRRNRPSYDDTGTRPLRFRPVVSAADHSPIVQMWWGPGRDEAAQMPAEAATMHGVHVLEVAAVIDLDEAYFRGLTRGLGLEELRARSAVDDLARFRRSATDAGSPGVA